MKNLILTMLLIVCCADNISAADKNIPLSVYVPPSSVLTDGNRQLITSKLQNIVTQIGYGAEGSSEQFVCYVKVVLIESQKIEGGMKTIIQNNYDFNFYIKDLKNNTVFSSANKNLRGSGYTNELAMNGALSGIKTNDQELHNFVKSGISKILNYYTQNCSNIIMEAKALAGKNSFEEAFYLLSSIPKAADSCYKMAMIQNQLLVKRYMEVNCKKQLAIADAHITNRDIEKGMLVMAGAAGVSSCAAEYNRLKAKAQTIMDQEQKNKWQYLFQEQKNNQRLAELQYETARDIAVAYYSNRPPVYNYNLIIW